MQRVLRIVFTTSAFVLPSISIAALPVDLDSQIRAIVTDEMAIAGTPAMSVAVVAEGRLVASIAVGYADLEARVLATTSTAFQAASLTKLLTATIVMHEVEQGRLSLDSPVNLHLSTERQVRDLNGSPVPVTLRQLLSHSSGIPFRSAMQMDPEEPLRTLDEHLGEGLKTIRPPGEKLIYASDGFGLAGWIAGQAAGVTYDQLTQRVLLSPLGMNSTSLVAPREYAQHLAAAYEGDHRIAHVSVSAGMPSGALLTTAEDLARFALFVLARGDSGNTRILRAESVNEMLRLGARLHPRVPEGFGLGFSIREEPGRKLAWWDGQLPGAASRLALLPDHNVGVIVLANRSDNDAVARVGNRVLNLLVPVTMPDSTSSTEPEDESNELIGFYQLSGMLAPPLSIAERFINFRISESPDGLTFSNPLSAISNGLNPIGDGLFRLQGGMFDGAYGVVDGDRLFVSVIEGRRVGSLQTATAWVVYSVTTVLGVLLLIGWITVRMFKWRRNRQSPIRL